MQTIKLGDIAIEAKESNKGDKTGCKIVGLEHLTPSDVTLSSWSEDTNNSFTKKFAKGDVLFGRRRAYLKKAALAPFDGICSGDITVIRAKEGKVDPRLLPFIIQNDFLFEFAVGKSAGSLSPRVKWEHLRNFEISLPDTDKQRELADILWSINETKQAYLELIKQTDELVKSQFIEMFGSGACDMTTVEKCCRKISGGGTPSMKHPEFYGGNVPFIKSGDVKEDHVSEGALWLTDVALQNTAAKLLPAGTVVVVVRSAALRHEFHIAITDVPVVINQDLKALQPKSGILPEYLMWAIKSRESDILQGVQTMLTSHIKIKDFLSIPVKNAKFEEQEAWANFVHQTDKSKFELQDAIDNLDALSKKIIAENLIAAGKE